MTKTTVEVATKAVEIESDKDFLKLSIFNETIKNINEEFTLSNNDVIKQNENGLYVTFSNDFNHFGTYQKMRKQLDYSIEYAQDRTLWVSYLMFKYEDEIVNYISSSEYKDKHCITTSGMKTEDLCEIDSLESLLDTFSQYIDSKKFDNIEDETNYQILKIEKENRQGTKQQIEINEIDYAISQMKKGNSKDADIKYSRRFYPTDFSSDESVDASELLEKNGAVSSNSYRDSVLSKKRIISQNEKKDMFNNKEDIAKTLDRAEEYLASQFNNKLETEIPRHFESTTNIVKRSLFSEHIDTHVDKIEWRNKLISEYKESIYEIEKSLGYYDENGLETSSEYRKEFYSMLHKAHGYKANNLRKLRSEMMSQFKVMFDSLLFVVKGDDMSHLYKGDLTLLNMNDVETYKLLLKEYSKLHESAAKDIDSELKWLIWELDDLIDRTVKNDTERLIIEGLKQGMSQVEISRGIDKDNKYVSSFLSESFPIKLLSVHKKVMDEYVYTYRVRGKFKTCKGNGKVYLATDRYFQKDKKGKFGLKARSKEYISEIKAIENSVNAS
ncbi:hypothetical protein FM106_31130 [Brachybacterium faecium]|nr:hypothetical protein FM106_31130 [Brachybacterium faecium]